MREALTGLCVRGRRPAFDVGEFPHIFFRCRHAVLAAAGRMPLDALQDRIRTVIEQLGFELVDLHPAGTRDRPILKVRIDRPDSAPGHGVTADDCGRASRALDRELEGAALVGPRYVLEVSSPGLDRPLNSPAHWRRFAGRKAKVRGAGLVGRTVVEILDVPDESRVRVRLPDGSERLLALTEVTEARLDVDWNSIGRDRR